MRMDNSPAEVMTQLLADLGLGVEGGTDGDWPVYTGNEPPSPDNVLTVYNTLGTSVKYQASNRAAGGRVVGKVESMYGVMIRARSSDPKVGWDKLDEIAQTLTEEYRRTVTLDGHTYLFHCVSNVGNVLDAGKEAPTSKRNLFTLNMTATIKQCT